MAYLILSIHTIMTGGNFISHGAPLKYSLWGRRTARAPRTIVHRTEPRAQPTSLDPRTLRTEHKVREISCSSLENCSFQFRLISNQGLYIIKVSSVWFDTFFVEFSVGLLNISWPKMDLQIMRYLHIKEQDQKSNIWPM